MTTNTENPSPFGFDPKSLKDKYRAERDARLRTDGLGQYVDLEGAFADYADDPYVEPGFTRDPVIETTDVLVLGGGIAGIQAAVQLKKAGVDRFRIVEEGGDFGGTWYWNRYPGVRCDIESYVYIPYLEEIGTVPSEKYAVGAEILGHLQAVARKFELYELALFQTLIRSIRWDEESAYWIVRTHRDDEIRARHVIVSTGLQNKPKLPGIPGIETFKGAAFHTSRWDYDYTGGESDGKLTKLQDKRVALIGTGATGIQVFPHVARWAKQVYLFQRTPSAVDRRNNRPTDVEWYKNQQPGWQKKRIDNFSLTIMGVPQAENLVADCWTDVATLLVGFNNSEDEAIKNAPVEEQMQIADFMKMEQIRARVDEVVKDPKTAEALKPWYNLFCKRPAFSDDYLPVFNQQNVTLIDTHGQGIDRITENSLIVEGESYEVDCIVFATGFRVGVQANKSGGYDLIGRDGVSLDDAWAKGVRSVHGLKIHGFPNFFVIGTLAQASQSFSFPHVTLYQADHAAKMVAKCLKDNVRTMEVTSDAQRRWTEEVISKAADNSAFEVACTPGYYNNEGNTKDAPSLFGSMYGGGPVEYISLLDRWAEEEHVNDVKIEYDITRRTV